MGNPLREMFKSSKAMVGMVQALRTIPADLMRWRGYLRRSSRIAAYLKETGDKNLQIGSGKNLLKGWLNTEYMPYLPEHVYLDGTARFPLPDNSFDRVYSEHVIEHVPYLQGQKLLKECLRILKPGGRIRCSTPNLRSLVSLLDEPLNELKREYIHLAVTKHMTQIGIEMPAFVVNNFFWDFWHFFVYEPDSLRKALESAGFEQVKQVESGVSEDPGLQGIERHGKVIGEEMDQFETMVFEAIKPG